MSPKLSEINPPDPALFKDPPFDDTSSALPPDYSSSQAATKLVADLFPTQWNLYLHTGWSYSSNISYSIGTHEDTLLFIVTSNGVDWLHPGQTIRAAQNPQDSAPLVEIKSETAGRNFAIATIAEAGDQHPFWCNSYPSPSEWTFKVQIPDDDGGSFLETFKWRDDYRERVRLILVRVEPITSGLVVEQPMATTDNGKEIVAIWSLDPTVVPSSVITPDYIGTFRFIGRGATGELGRTWVIMAVTSICRIHQVAMENAQMLHELTMESSEADIGTSDATSSRSSLLESMDPRTQFKLLAKREATSLE